MTGEDGSSTSLYVLRRRGNHDPEVINIVVVRAPSESHARVLAADCDEDLAWGDPAATVCECPDDADCRVLAAGR